MIGDRTTLGRHRSIPENMYTLAARIEDADHGSDWLDSCRKSYTIRDTDHADGRPNRVQFEAYERLKGLPLAGISDRDVYLHGEWRRDGENLVCDLSPSTRYTQAPPAGVERMADLQAQFVLRPKSAGATRVTYALNVDLGGSVPGWIRDLAVKEIPRKSLDNLAREANKGPGIYEQHGRELAAALDALA